MKYSNTFKGLDYGSSNINAKLNEEVVKIIRKEYDNRFKSQADLAKEYRVSRVTIKNIVQRKSWRHVV